MSDKALNLLIYKGLIQINKKKSTLLIDKLAKNIDKSITKEKTNGTDSLKIAGSHIVNINKTVFFIISSFLNVFLTIYFQQGYRRQTFIHFWYVNYVPLSKGAISEYLSTFKMCIPFHTSIPCLGTSTVTFKLPAWRKNIRIFTVV